MGSGWKRLPFVAGLLLLTYLLLQSRSPDLALRARLHAALHAVELYDARLTRDVLLARAGLLPHYDPLAQASRGLSQALETLRQGSQHASGEAAKVLGQHLEALDAALRQKLTLIEHFSTDNALLRNSLMYLHHAGEALRGEAGAAGYETVAAEVGALSHGLLRFLQTPDPLIGEETIPARYQEAHTQAFARWAATGHAHLMGMTVEWAGVCKDGSEFALELSLSLWSTTQGCYVTGIIRDLTARKRLEEHTRQQELQLIQANKMTALGTLVSGVAHEINNPNQLVRMNARMLADAWHDTLGILDAYQRKRGDFLLAGLLYEEMRETLPALVQDMHDGALRIERIVEDLRDFARPRTPGISETFVLNEAVQRGLRLLTPLIRRKTAHFHVDLAADIPPVQGESQHVEQIVVNLVVNALEALPAPGRRVMVATRFEPAECCGFLAVEDEGIGIPPEHQARLCDPFFTTKHESGGTGLGLAITSTLVRAHGGRLTFSSEPGRGTRALVMLPCLSKWSPLQAELASHPPTDAACSRNPVP